jgi:hypothetical protein
MVSAAFQMPRRPALTVDMLNGPETVRQQDKTRHDHPTPRRNIVQIIEATHATSHQTANARHRNLFRWLSVWAGAKA